MILFVYYMLDFWLNIFVCICVCLFLVCDFVYIFVFNEVYMWCVCILIYCNLVICDIYYELIYESLNGKSKKIIFFLDRLYWLFNYIYFFWLWIINKSSVK